VLRNQNVIFYIISIIIIVVTISAVSTLSLGIGHQANKPKPLCVTMSTGINGTSDGRDGMMQTTLQTL